MNWSSRVRRRHRHCLCYTRSRCIYSKHDKCQFAKVHYVFINLDNSPWVERFREWMTSRHCLWYRCWSWPHWGGSSPTWSWLSYSAVWSLSSTDLYLVCSGILDSDWTAFWRGKGLSLGSRWSESRANCGCTWRFAGCLGAAHVRSHLWLDSWRSRIPESRRGRRSIAICRRKASSWAFTNEFWNLPCYDRGWIKHSDI